MMKVLFTSPIDRSPTLRRIDLRVENSVKALMQVCDLHFVSSSNLYLRESDNVTQYCQKLSAPFCYTPSFNFLSWRYLRDLQNLGRKLWSNQARNIVDYANHHQIKMIWFGQGHLSFPLIRQVHALAPHLSLICDTDRVSSRLLFQELPFIHSKRERNKVIKETQKKEQQERLTVACCEKITTANEAAAQYYHYLTPHKEKITLFANGLDLAIYQKQWCTPDLKRPAIYLAGCFNKSRSATKTIHWLLKGILPEVKKVIPNVHCYIANDTDIALDCKSAQITVIDHKENRLAYLKNSDVALTLLGFDPHTPLKILEAGACKVPLVSTPLEATDLPLINGKHILINQDTKEIAQAIIRLIQNPVLAQSLINHNHQLAQQFGLNALVQQARDILTSLAQQSNKQVMGY